MQAPFDESPVDQGVIEREVATGGYQCHCSASERFIRNTIYMTSKRLTSLGPPVCGQVSSKLIRAHLQSQRTDLKL